MKFALYPALFMSLVLASSESGAKVDLLCKAIDYEVVPELNRTLGGNQIRAVTPTLAGFVDSETFSLKVSTECEGRGEDKVCISIADENYCPNDKSSFRVRGVGSSGKTLMVKNRCTDSWVKYTKISQTGDTANFIEDEVYFQLKNQIYSGVNISKKPILSIAQTNNDGEVTIQVASFSRELWHVKE